MGLTCNRREVFDSYPAYFGSGCLMGCRVSVGSHLLDCPLVHASKNLNRAQEAEHHHEHQNADWSWNNPTQCAVNVAHDAPQLTKVVRKGESLSQSIWLTPKTCTVQHTNVARRQLLQWADATPSASRYGHRQVPGASVGEAARSGHDAEPTGRNESRSHSCAATGVVRI